MFDSLIVEDLERHLSELDGAILQLRTLCGIVVASKRDMKPLPIQNPEVRLLTDFGAVQSDLDRVESLYGETADTVQMRYELHGLMSKYLLKMIH